MGTNTRAGRGGLIQLPGPMAGFFMEGEEIEALHYSHHIGLWKRWQRKRDHGDPSSKTTRATVYWNAADRYTAVVATLKQAGLPEVALYLAGYIVECRLKWAVCQQWDVRHLDEAEYMIAQREGREHGLTGGSGHDLELLLRLAGDQGLLNDRDFADSWRLCTHWSPNWRYWMPLNTVSQSAAYFVAFQLVDARLKEAR